MSKLHEMLETAPTPMLWLHLGDLSADPTCYEKAWTLSDNKCAPAQLKLASVAMKQERWGEARAHLQQALAVRTHYPEAWYCSAICLLKQDHATEAMAELRKVIALDPTHYQAWSALGGLFAKARMKREALYAFRGACKLRGDQPDLWTHAALAALDVGHFEEAIFCSQRAVGLGGAPAPQVSSLVRPSPSLVPHPASPLPQPASPLPHPASLLPPSLPLHCRPL